MRQGAWDYIEKPPSVKTMLAAKEGAKKELGLDAFEVRAVAYGQTGDREHLEEAYDQARDLLDESRDGSREQVRVSTMLELVDGRLALLDKEYGHCRRQLQLVLDANPTPQERATAEYRLGEVEEATGDVAEASKHYAYAALHDHPEAAGVRLRDDLVKHLERTVLGVDVAVVGDVVAVVRVWRGVERREPDARHAEALDVVELAEHAPEVADAVTVTVAEAPRPDLVEHHARSINVISIAVDAPEDTISALAGRIGSIPGASAKTAYSSAVYDA